MPLPKTSRAEGSAVVEFIVFVLFGQLLVFTGGMQLAQWLDTKLKLELSVHQLARAVAMGKSGDFLPELQRELPEFRFKVFACGEELVCVMAESGDLFASGVSYASEN
jgi:hypothetical protein